MALERGKIWQKKNSIVLLVVCRQLPKKKSREAHQHNIHASFDNRPFIVQLLWLPLWMVLIFFLLPTRSRFNNGNQFPVVSLVTFMTSNQSK